MARSCEAETLASLADDWDAYDVGQRRQVLESIFSEIVVEEGRLVSATPRPVWLDYIEQTGVLKADAGFSWRRRRESRTLRTELRLELRDGRLVRADVPPPSRRKAA